MDIESKKESYYIIWKNILNWRQYITLAWSLQASTKQPIKKKHWSNLKKGKQKAVEMKIEELNKVVHSIEHHLDGILNFFDRRSTNAYAESFNSKIKGFRANLRGVTDIKFFLFRLEKLYAKHNTPQKFKVTLFFTLSIFQFSINTRTSLSTSRGAACESHFHEGSCPDRRT